MRSRRRFRTAIDILSGMRSSRVSAELAECHKEFALALSKWSTQRSEVLRHHEAANELFDRVTDAERGSDNYRLRAANSKNSFAWWLITQADLSVEDCEKALD